MDIDGANIVEYFEVIEIMDESNLHPVLLGLDWHFHLDAISKLKRRSTVFDKNDTRVIAPLDPSKGARYKEPIHEECSDEDIDHIYKLTARDGDWINPNSYGRISWEKDNSCHSDSDKELENWKN